jgi:hypothetical protein
MNWKPFPEGTRVKHSDEGYEGWVDGVTEIRKGGKVNPDGKSKYRIRSHDYKIALAAEQEIEHCKDLERVFRSTATLLQKKIDKQSHDKKENERWRQWNFIVPLPCTIWALGEYRPERNQIGKYVSSRGDHTQHILNLKKVAASSSVDYFIEKLDEILAHGFPICMIPSSAPSTINISTGLETVIRRLAQKDRVDATSVLIRHRGIMASQSASHYKSLLKRLGISIDKIDMLVKKGEVIDPGVIADRGNISRHLDTIKVVDSCLIRSQVVLLLDDIVTTGTSFMGCRKLLLDAGASEVVCLALGITARARVATDVQDPLFL